MIILGECVHRDFISKQQYLCTMIKNTYQEIPLKMYMKRPASRDNNAQKGIFAQSVDMIQLTTKISLPVRLVQVAKMML